MLKYIISIIVIVHFGRNAQGLHQPDYGLMVLFFIIYQNNNLIFNLKRLV